MGERVFISPVLLGTLSTSAWSVVILFITQVMHNLPITCQSANSMSDGRPLLFNNYDEIATKYSPTICKRISTPIPVRHRAEGGFCGLPLCSGVALRGSFRSTSAAAAAVLLIVVFFPCTKWMSKEEFNEMGRVRTKCRLYSRSIHNPVRRPDR